MNAPAISMTWPQYLRGECTYRGHRIHLPRKPAEIIALLLMRRGQIVSAPEIIAYLWPDPDRSPEFETEVLRKHVCILRARVRDVVQTAWGRGFYIDLPVDEPLAEAA